MGHNTALGAYGEGLAVDYLRSAGLKVVQRNWRCQFGEIDIVALDGHVTAIVEVKTRSSLEYGLPLEAVDLAKQRRLKQLAWMWLRLRRGPWVDVRFDVVSVLIEQGGDPVIEHYKGVF